MRVCRVHNNKILKDEEEQGQCNCVPDTCPVQGECQTSGLVYRATVTTGENTTFKYVGLTEGTFKERHRKHLSNFRTRNRKNKTTLSEKIWDLEDRSIDFEIKWEILQRAKPYQPGSEDCHLCLTEVYYILFKPQEADLNSRLEFMNKCRHSNKFKLCNVQF